MITIFQKNKITPFGCADYLQEVGEPQARQRSSVQYVFYAVIDLHCENDAVHFQMWNASKLFFI